MSESQPDAVTLDRADVQGLAFYAYKHARFAAYCLFRITDRRRYQAFLTTQLAEGSITSTDWKAKAKREERSIEDIRPLNIAFTASGMKKLLGAGWVEESYDSPFIEGMATPYRSRLLGDVEANDPSKWFWGDGDDIDGVMMVFGLTRSEVESRAALLEQSGGFQRAISELFIGDREPTGRRTPDKLKGKEPFGFVDGISQPVIIGTERHRKLVKEKSPEAELQGVPPGEFILGYPDGTDKNWEKLSGKEALPRSPATSAAADANDNLSPHWEWPERRDLGKNGAYLVLRQLEQDVEKFWAYLETARKPDEDVDELAAKLVGRRKDGTALRPVAPANASGNNDFNFSDDAHGVQCPLGSHIRRANPRTFGIKDKKNASRRLRVTNRHRIIRRGRVYVDENGVAEGLFFLCVNASINRQFEFVQSAWCDSQFFGGLKSETDPIIGTIRPAAKGLDAINKFTIPDDPYRRQLSDMPQFVTVRGGAYFFLPGLKALSCLAHAP